MSMQLGDQGVSGERLSEAGVASALTRPIAARPARLEGRRSGPPTFSWRPGSPGSYSSC